MSTTQGGPSCILTIRSSASKLDCYSVWVELAALESPPDFPELESFLPVPSPAGFESEVSAGLDSPPVSADFWGVVTPLPRESVA